MHLVLFLRFNCAQIAPDFAPDRAGMRQAVFFCSPRTTVQRFNFEIGLDSSIHTVSPGLNWLFSSWA
jgi:hypothetical protein